MGADALQVYIPATLAMLQRLVTEVPSDRSTAPRSR